MPNRPFLSYRNLIEVIQDKHETNRGITFIESADNKEFVSYCNLYKKALKALSYLQGKGLKPRDELVFQVYDNLNFLSLFWACILGHIIPVPVTTAYFDRNRFKLFSIWEVLNRPYLIIRRDDIEQFERFAAKNSLGNIFHTIKKKTLLIDDMKKVEREGKICFPNESDIAFVQFSSGSTSQSKGVMLTHENLLINVRDIIKGYKSLDRVERSLSWLPLTHDMGLIALHLVATVGHWDQFMMPTRLFTRDPLQWLNNISYHKITYTGSPNSGLRLVLRFFNPEKNRDLDLSSLRVILNGAEPISAELCREFFHALAPLGLKKSAMVPGYGLAEACAIVSLSDPSEEIVEVHVNRNSLNIEQTAEEISKDSDNAVTFVEVGTPVDECSVRIVGEKQNVLGERRIGHIQIKGDHVTSGYYNNREETSQAITSDGWLDTGDLGFLRGNRLVITGRVKDTIFVNGLTYFANDIEFICQELAELKYSRIAVCGVYNHRLQSDEVICFVVFKKDLRDFLPLSHTLRKHIVKKAGVGVSHVIPVQQIPTTTSGKIQRYKMKEAYLKGEFDSVLQRLSTPQAEN